MSDWRPIETAPRDGTKILAVIRLNTGARLVAIVEMDDDGISHIAFDDGYVMYSLEAEAEVWQALPDLPEAKR